MIVQELALEEEFRNVAIEAVQFYTPGILSVDVLIVQMRQQWIQHEQQGAQPAPDLLRRIAQRCCSQALYNAWQSCNPQVRESASTILIKHLKLSLQRTRYVSALSDADYAIEEIVQETLLDMQRGYRGEIVAGPSDPAAFLKWSQTILMRHARVVAQKVWRDRGRYVSLEEELAAHPEQSDERPCFIESRDHDPLDEVLIVELQQALKDAILSLRNRHYRDVLLYTYLAGLNEEEMSRLWKVSLQTIYLWRHRALDTLRKNPALIRRLRSLRE